MNRRKLFGVLATALVGLVACAGTGTAAEDKRAEDKDDVRDRCAKACADCMTPTTKCSRRSTSITGSGVR